MDEQRRVSRVAQLLSAYGVGDTMSIREAATRCGVSRETMSKLMREIPSGRTRRIQSKNLDKISEGLHIPRDLLEREMMADWGYVATATDGDVAAILAAFTRLSPKDQLSVQAEIIRLQQSRLGG